MHDDEVMELQQQFAEAKRVIQQLAGQVDHYSNMQQQLAGLPIILLCSGSFVLHTCSCLTHIPSHPLCKPHLLLQTLLNALAVACAACASVVSHH